MKANPIEYIGSAVGAAIAKEYAEGKGIQFVKPRPRGKPITPESLAASGTEEGHQTALFCYAVEAARDDYRWSLMYAVPNGGKRDQSVAASMVATGVKRGFPDIGLPTAMGGFHGLYVELKRPKIIGKRGGLIGGGVVDDDQEQWHNRLMQEGYCVAVCYGWIAAKTTIAAYLAGDIDAADC